MSNQLSPPPYRQTGLATVVNPQNNAHLRTYYQDAQGQLQYIDHHHKRAPTEPLLPNPDMRLGTPIAAVQGPNLETTSVFAVDTQFKVFQKNPNIIEVSSASSNTHVTAYRDSSSNIQVFYQPTEQPNTIVQQQFKSGEQPKQVVDAAYPGTTLTSIGSGVPFAQSLIYSNAANTGLRRLDLSKSGAAPEDIPVSDKLANSAVAAVTVSNMLVLYYQSRNQGNPLRFIIRTNNGWGNAQDVPLSDCGCTVTPDKDTALAVANDASTDPMTVFLSFQHKGQIPNVHHKVPQQ